MDFPDEIRKVIERAVMDLTIKMRESGIPDDWRIDVTFEEVGPYIANQNEVRVIATPRPPYNRFTGEGMD